MKIIVKSILTLLLASGLAVYSGSSVSAGTFSGLVPDSIKISCSPELKSLVTGWVTSYTTEFPEVKISVAETDPSTTSAGLVFMIETGSNELFPWKMVLGHDALVPVINNSSPLAGSIRLKGLSPEQVKNIAGGNGKVLWSSIIEGTPAAPAILYLENDPSIVNSISKFSGFSISANPSVILVKDSEIIQKVLGDKNAIGFIKLSQIINHPEMKNLSFIPVDRNANGKMDSYESIYDNPDELKRGIIIGKYPSVLCQSIIAASGEMPAEKVISTFLRWIITDGSPILSENGLIAGAGSEKDLALSSLNAETGNVADQPVEGTGRALILVFGSLLVLVVVITLILARPGVKTTRNENVMPKIKQAFSPATILSPKGLFFDKSHTWTFMERDGLVRFGVDDFIQSVTGSITGIKLKETGDEVRRGEKIMSLIRNGKQIDLYSPVTGTIRSLNTNLLIDPSTLNASPYSDGWVYLIEPSNWVREMQLMFMFDKYRSWISGEFDRLKKFVSTISFENNTCAHVIMQDGGELTNNILAELEPEVWEDFQQRFIDTSR